MDTNRPWDQAMSRYQLTQHWPIADRLVPVGSIIDTVAGTDDFSKLVVARGLSPPIQCIPLDQATWNTMKDLYGGNHTFVPFGVLGQVDMTPWIVTGPGITR
jgi:hypothetical protein